MERAKQRRKKRRAGYDKGRMSAPCNREKTLADLQYVLLQ